MSIEDLQHAVGQLPQVAFPLKHHFADGAYCRELFIPKNGVLVGAKHKTNHLFLLVSGKCIISKDEISETFTGPCMMHTTNGDKRAIFALEDTIIMTFHVTDKTDLIEIGCEILEPDNCLPLWKIEGLN